MTAAAPSQPAFLPSRLLGLLGWLPASLALAWCLWFRVGIPEPADWVFIRHEASLPLRWVELFRVDSGSAFLGFRCLYLALLSIPGFSFEFANLLPWVAALCAWRVGRRLLRRLIDPATDPRSLWAVDLLLSLWMFHPAWGTDWLLAGRVREFLPLLTFGLTVLVLQGAGRWRLRWSLALVCVGLAQASGITGLLAWLAIGPAVLGAARERSVPRPAQSTLSLLAWGAILYLVIWQGFRVSDPDPGLLAIAVAEPTRLLSYLCHTTATVLPTPLPGFELAQGAGIWLLVLLAWGLAVLRRRRLDAVAGAFLALSLFGALGLLALVDATCLGRPELGQIPAAFVREGGVGAVALLLGSYGLLWRCLPGCTRHLHSLLLGALLLILVRDWHLGFEHLKEGRCLVRAQAAELLLEEATPGGGVVRTPPADSTLRHSLLAPADLRDLRRRGFLDHLPALPGLDLSAYPSPESVPCGEFAGLVGAELRGLVLGTTSRPAPGLVLVARQRADRLVVVGVMRPDFNTGVRQVPVVGAPPAPESLQNGDRLRAFGLELRPLALRPLRGVFELGASGLVRVEGAGK